MTVPRSPISFSPPSLQVISRSSMRSWLRRCSPSCAAVTGPKGSAAGRRSRLDRSSSMRTHKASRMPMISRSRNARSTGSRSRSASSTGTPTFARRCGGGYWRPPCALRRTGMRMRSAAYSSGDEVWRLTAVFCMRFVRGFEEQILEALDTENPDIYYEAVVAAGNWGLDAAWPQVAALVTSTKTDKPLLLAAIEAIASIRPHEAVRMLDDLADSHDEDIAAARGRRAPSGEDDDDDDCPY